MFPVIMGHNQWFDRSYSAQMPVVMPVMPRSATIGAVAKVERNEENFTARQNPQAPPTCGFSFLMGFHFFVGRQQSR